MMMHVDGFGGCYCTPRLFPPLRSLAAAFHWGPRQQRPTALERTLVSPLAARDRQQIQVIRRAFVSGERRGSVLSSPVTNCFLNSSDLTLICPIGILRRWFAAVEVVRVLVPAWEERQPAAERHWIDRTHRNSLGQQTGGEVPDRAAATQPKANNTWRLGPLSLLPPLPPWSSDRRPWRRQAKKARSKGS